MQLQRAIRFLINLLTPRIVSQNRTAFHFQQTEFSDKDGTSRVTIDSTKYDRDPEHPGFNGSWVQMQCKKFQLGLPQNIHNKERGRTQWPNRRNGRTHTHTLVSIQHRIKFFLGSKTHIIFNFNMPNSRPQSLSAK
jgi:hypothetical protein